MERRNILEVADIFSGLFKKQSEKDANTAYIQLINLHQFSIMPANKEEVRMSVSLSDKEKNGKHLLKEGDILLVVKGTPRAVIYHPVGDIPAVASTSFAVIRVKEEYAGYIKPEYLCWWLNSSYAYEVYDRELRGSSVKVLPLKLFNEFEINIPSLEYQEHFIEFNRQSEERQQITQEIAQTIRKLNVATLENMAGILK